SGGPPGERNGNYKSGLWTGEAVAMRARARARIGGIKAFLEVAKRDRGERVRSSGNELRDQTWVMAGSRSQPTVLALEDGHWADPTTLDLVRGIAERGALAPLFVLMTARPEFRAPWGTRSHHGAISLAQTRA